MQVIAKAKYIHMSPRKVRLIVDLIRGMDVNRAETQLAFSKKLAARPVLKLLHSAVANAEHNFKMSSAHLYIKSITADGGPMMKRFRARAFGRAADIHKRSSHITIILDARGTANNLAQAVVEQDNSKKS